MFFNSVSLPYNKIYTIYLVVFYQTIYDYKYNDSVDCIYNLKSNQSH